MKVFELIAQAFIDEEPGAIFVLLGNSNMRLGSAIDTRGGPPMYHARHEGTVIGMAEGYARSTGRLGVAMVTNGPSLVNTATALTSAVRAHTPMVVFTGHGHDQLHHQYFSQEGLALLTGAGYYQVREVDQALDFVHRAFYQARTEERPVIIDVPREVQHATYDWDYSYRPSLLELKINDLPPTSASIEQALDLIAASERPVLLAGAGAVAADCRLELLALAEEVGALLATSLYAKNFFAGEEFDLGIAGLFSWRHTAEILHDADLIVGVGASLNYYTLEGGYMMPEAKYVQIDSAAPKLLGNQRTADAFIHADARTGVAALRQEINQRGLSRLRWRTDEVRETLRAGRSSRDDKQFELEPGLADPRLLMRAIDGSFPTDAGVVVGTGHSWGFPTYELRQYRTPQLYSNAFGSIGIALPLAIGAAVGNPGRPFLHLEGDGSVMMNIHCFDTLAAYNLPVFVVVQNDAAFGSEVHQLRASQLKEDVAYLGEVDFASVAQSFGCRAATVTSEDEMEKAIAEFVAAPGPYVVNAKISRQVVTTAVRRLHYGEDA